MKKLISLSLFLAACAVQPTGQSPDATDVSVDSSDLVRLDACQAVDAWLADPHDTALRVWFGGLGLPPGACLDVECPDGEPALRLCVGTGKPPIQVECQ